MTTRFTIKKENGWFSLERLSDYMKNAGDGLYKICLEKAYNPRSKDQNAYLWGCVYPMILDGLVELGWEFTNVAQVHEYCKARFTRKEIVNVESGRVMVLPESTAEMNTAEMGAYFTTLQKFASEYLGVDVPDPDKYWRLSK